MITEVNFQLAQLLKYKLNLPIRSKSGKVYIEGKLKKRPATQLCLVEEIYPSAICAPLIAEVVMILLSKYGIWISVDTIGGEWYYSIYKHELNFETKQLAESSINYNSPNEAYEAGIVEALNLI